MKDSFKVTETKLGPLGIYFEETGLHATAVFHSEHADDSDLECGIILYDKRHPDGIKIPFPKESRIGSVYTMLLKGYQNRDCSYLFYCKEQLFQDPYARAVENDRHYGVYSEEIQKCKVPASEYDWMGDKPLHIPYENCILYAIHVRGFTKHRSSGVKKKGTYAGITEKIPYLKELGITSLLLMPSYEFDEVLFPENSPAMSMEQAAVSYKQPILPKDAGTSGQQSCRINYWGYQKGLYRVPKSAYAYGKDSVTEFKDMVRLLHQNNIEVMMQFFFPPETRHSEILEIIKYWVLEYHIDGFHLMGVNLPLEILATEPLLSDTKLLTEREFSFGKNESPTGKRNVGWMSEGFLYDIRRLLKGDDNMINNFLFHVRNNRQEAGIINYIAKWDGLRLYDLVSYDRKHNEANGEQNQDGTNYNCSWNCGVEGKSRRKSITSLRTRQIKNALAFLFLSQGTPLLYGGDEFLNTQDGNNNPYCQDNAIAWIKWNQTKDAQELLAFTRALIRLRMENPILHNRAPLKGSDFRSCGYPDISFHGKEAWRPDTSPASRCIGVMYCGGQETSDPANKVDTEDSFFYIGVNMHWETHTLGLPKLPKGKAWTMLLSTYEEEEEQIQITDLKQEILIPPRTIALYISKDCLQKEIKQKKRGNAHE